MANLISASSDLVSSLQPPDADGLNKDDLAKRFLELESQIGWLKEENRRLIDRDYSLEEERRSLLMSLEDKEELIIRLKENSTSMSGTEDRLKDKYRRLIEQCKADERKWRGDLDKAEVRNRQLEVEMKKMEIDLQAARRVGGGDVKLVDAEVERLKRFLEVKDGEIAELKRRNEILETEKVKIKTVMLDRVIKLEESIPKIVALSSVGIGCNAEMKGIGDFKGSGAETVAKFLIEPKKESVEEEIDVGHKRKLDSKVSGIRKEVSPVQKSPDPPVSLGEEIDVGHKRKLDSKVSGIRKEVSPVQKSPDPPVVEISDDEEEESGSCNVLKTKMASSEDSSDATGQPTTKAITSLIHKGTKGHENRTVPLKRKSKASAYSPGGQSETKQSKDEGPKRATADKMFNAFTANGTKGHENLTVNLKRKSEALAYCPGGQSETKRSKNEGPKWATADKMFNAFTANGELCMKSVCALYRKHKSLGVWKNHSNGSRAFKPEHEINGVMYGELLTDRDPEGRMKKSLADFGQQNRVIEDCRFICRNHFKDLFEIYNNNMDPMFIP